VIEAQRRIHELEAQREREREMESSPSAHAPERPRMEEARQPEPPAFLVREESRHEPKPERRPEPAPEPAAPRIDAKEVLEQSGLVMIETDRSKAPAPQPVAEEQVRLGRPRRERPREQQSEELQQVETKR